MAIGNLLRWLRRKQQLPETVLQRDRFQVLLDAERMRADRSGGVFSVVLVDAAEHPEHFHDMARFLSCRLRQTDFVGKTGRNRLAILLTDTSQHGASVVVQAIHDHPAGNLNCHVFVYPRVPEADRDDDLGGGSDEDMGGSGEQDRESSEALFAKRLPIWKRAVDFVGAAAGLLLFSPIMLTAACAVKLTSRGPVFFTQERAGQAGKPFTIYKFRTMTADAEDQKSELRIYSEQDGPAFKIVNDPRITTVGRFLRKTCIDEMPQLWNVLRGDMSLVGPRPLPTDEANRCESWERRRLDVNPGLTCIWQTRDEPIVPFSDWMRMDLRYIRQGGIVRDVRLIVKTVLRMVLLRASH